MTRMFNGGLVALTIVGCLVSGAEAFWLDAMFDHCHHVSKINQRWPSPHLCPDRVAAHAPFDAMIRNGWRRQNLLGSHHFKTGSTQLTRAGELKVRWIMTQTPSQYRRVFVENSYVEGETEKRIASVTEYANKSAVNGQVPQVIATHIMSEGHPAATVDFVNNQFRENMRIPVLPASTTSGGGQ